MHIGLLAGIGPAATDFYYRGLIDRHVAGGIPLDLTMAHADVRGGRSEKYVATRSSSVRCRLRCKRGVRPESAKARSLAMRITVSGVRSS